jgi:hypothetical protein
VTACALKKYFRNTCSNQRELIVVTPQAEAMPTSPVMLEGYLAVQ